MGKLPDGSVCRDNDGDWVVDPETVAPRLGLTSDEFRRAMREGRIGGTVERGEGEDAGRARLTFRYAQRSWSIRIEPDGSAFETAPPVRPDNALGWLQGSGKLS